MSLAPVRTEAPFPAASVVHRIAERTRRDLAARRSALPERELRARLADAPPPRDFAAALRGPGFSLIAEFKPRSPSRGAIRPGAAPEDLAAAYAPYAAAISVLCDRPFFGGGFDQLARMRAAVEQPVLCKDFVLDRYQLLEARVHGADAVLLMASLLDGDALPRLHDEARDLGLCPLVETHTDEELDRVLRGEAEVVGVNARDLRDLRIDRARAARRLARVPADRVRVAESGLTTAGEVQEAARVADAGLIGSALMAAPDPAAAIEALGFRPGRGGAPCR